jgi:bacillithiol biosynthesis cysteine-adding enzyme BshC
MKSALIDTGILSSCTQAFVEQNDKLKALLGYDHTYFSVEKAIANKQSFEPKKRAVLVNALKAQYSNYLGTSFKAEQKALIETLNDPNTFTVTTGQQLHIGIGPVFVLYKIIATIQLCKSLQNQYPDIRFVPLYWMASEDHDIEEIRHTNLFGKTHTWATQQKGATGRLSVEGIDELYQTLLDTYQLSDQQKHWVEAFKTIYSHSKTLSEATFKCILHVFEHDGLLCLDADQTSLKTQAITLFKTDILEQKNETVFNNTTQSLLDLGFSKQLHARAINCFYLQEQSRERIEKTNDGYSTSDQSKHWTASEIANEIEQHPERFSPNAVLRPLYQESILPNVVYLGGNAEIHYWIQLSGLFKLNKVEAPCLMLRPSVWFCPIKTLDWLDQRQIDPLELIQNSPVDSLKIKLGGTENPLTLLKNQFEAIKKEAQNQATKYSIQGLKELVDLGKQYDKQLQKLEQSIQTEMDKRIDSDLKKLQDLQQKYFNSKAPQERHLSVLEFLLNYSISAILAIKESDLSPNNAYLFSA